ncbi:MAG: hypothetical protein IJO26_00590 [Clostridium sp.]|nr:hypothetical protein [Clostridium sp.]
MSNQDIYNKIYNHKNKLRKYEDSIDYLYKAKNKALKIESGLGYIKNTHYSNTCDESSNAIGYQSNLISALNISSNSIFTYNDNILSEIILAISILEDKVTQLEDEISSFYSLLE